VSWLDAEEIDDKDRLEALHGMSQIGNGAIYGAYAKSFPQRVSSSFKSDPTLVLNSHVFKRIRKEKGVSTALSHFKSVFLHEMGHAVGLLHEHAQEKSTCSASTETVEIHYEVWKNAGVRPSQVNVVATKYDPYSIMNYCYIIERGSTVAISLSDKDIATVNALYPSMSGGTQGNATGKQQMNPPVIGTSSPDSQQPIYQPVVGQPASPTTCNSAQLQICLNNGGGFACYGKWKCWDLCPKDSLELRGNPGL